jgi:hypothetical protein
VSWIESDRLTEEARLFQGPNAADEFLQRATAMLTRKFGGGDLMQYYMDRIGEIAELREEDETWEEAHDRLEADGTLARLDAESPPPDLAALGYKRFDSADEVPAARPAPAPARCRRCRGCGPLPWRARGWLGGSARV